MDSGAAESVIELVLDRFAQTAASGADGFPMYADSDTGTWVTTPDAFWTGGFWLGGLWHLAARERISVDLVEEWLDRLTPKAAAPTSLRGLLFWYGAGLGARLLDHGGARRAALAGADALAQSFCAPAGVFPLGLIEGDTLETNIDGVAGTAALLAWAAATAGNNALREIAERDATRHAELCLRADGSVAQSVQLNAHSGDVISVYNEKGLNATSTWARGQAWAMLGFTQAAVWIDPSFVEPATRAAEWWIEHLPRRGVVSWDFSDPDGLLDTSATAIAARALFTLASLAPSQHERYHDTAIAMLDALVSRHLTQPVSDGRRPAGMLLDGCYNHNAAWADRHELIWGDYFLLETLLELSRPAHQPTAP